MRLLYAIGLLFFCSSALATPMHVYNFEIVHVSENMSGFTKTTGSITYSTGLTGEQSSAALNLRFIWDDFVTIVATSLQNGALFLDSAGLFDLSQSRVVFGSICGNVIPGQCHDGDEFFNLHIGDPTNANGDGTITYRTMDYVNQGQFTLAYQGIVAVSGPGPLGLMSLGILGLFARKRLNLTS